MFVKTHHWINGKTMDAFLWRSLSRCRHFESLSLSTCTIILRHQVSWPCHMSCMAQVDRHLSGEEMEDSPPGQQKPSEEEKEFSEVRAKRKRKTRATQMDVEDTSLESAPKRPNFPPVDASTMLVGIVPPRGELVFQGFPYHSRGVTHRDSSLGTRPFAHERRVWAHTYIAQVGMLT